MRKNFIKFSQQSFIADYIQKYILFISKKIPLFTIVLLYLGSLIFVNSNLTLLFATFILVYLIYKQTKNIITTFTLSFLLTLPFAKGKSWKIMMLAKEYVVQNSLFDINYYFPIYLSDVILTMIFWIVIRNQKIKKEFFGRTLTPDELALSAFIIFSAISAIFSSQYLVGLLSTIQLVKLFFILLFTRITAKNLQKNFLIEIIVASMLFQNILTLVQYFHDGPLGLYIESYLPGAYFGIRAFEETGLLRTTGTFFEPSILGTFLLLQSTVLWKFLQDKISPIHRKLIYFNLFLTLPTIILTGSRGIYLIGGFITTMTLKKNIQIIKSVKIKKILLITVSLIILMISPYFLERIFSLRDLFSQYGSGTYRLQIAKQAILLAFEKPFGTGLSVSPFEFAIKDYGEVVIFDPAHPHNILFQILAETGFLGLLFFSLFMYYSYQELKKDQKLWNPFMLGSAVFLICAQIYPIFLNHPELLTFFFLYLGLAKNYDRLQS